jgi:hypothetical protein
MATQPQANCTRWCEVRRSSLTACLVAVVHTKVAATAATVPKVDRRASATAQKGGDSVRRLQCSHTQLLVAITCPNTTTCCSAYDDTESCLTAFCQGIPRKGKTESYNTVLCHTPSSNKTKQTRGRIDEQACQWTLSHNID